MTTPSSALAIIPAAVESATVPKPTKNEIIEALVKLRIQQINKERAEVYKHKQELSKKACALLEKHVRKIARLRETVVATYLGEVWNNSRSLERVKAEINFEHGNKLPLEVEKAIRDYHACKVAPAPDEKAIRAEIRARAAGPRVDRVKALLDSPDARKALEATLEEIGVTPKPQTIEA